MQAPGRASIQKPWNMRTSITPWHPPRIRPPYSADGAHFLTTLTVRCRSSFPLSIAVPHSRSRYQVNIPKADDNYNSVRDEFTGMLKNQIAKSNNGIERSKYITFGIPAEGIAEARPRLERVEADVMGNFKRLGVPSEPMDGRARLALLHSQMPFRGAARRSAFRGKTSHRPGLAQKTLLPRTVSTSASPAHSVSASIGARCPTCRLWHRSFRISCWRKSWSWMQK